MKPATPPSSHVTSIRIYLRQSKDETTQQSTARQQSLNDRCLDGLRARGVVTDGMPVEIYTDINCARYDFTRPGFLRFMGEVGKGDVVVVTWRDRLGSGPRYTVAAEDIVKVRGARLFIADPVAEEITWDKTRSLVEAIHGSQADAYVEDLKQKTTAALREQLGLGYAAGNVPFGYTTEPDPTRRKMLGALERLGKKILIADGEAKVVVRIFEMRAKPMGWVAIAKTLNADGVRSAKGAWGSGSVRQTVNNSAYVCLWSMGKRKMLKSGGLRTMVPGDNATLVKVPDRLRIVPQELWERVQAVNEQRRRSPRMNQGRPAHALVGVLRCNECGGAFSTSYGKSGRRKVRLYSCSRRRRSGECDAKGTVPADRLEAAIIGAASKILVVASAAIQRKLRERANGAAARKRPDVSQVDVELAAAAERLRKARKIAYASDDESEETIAHLKRLGDDVKRLELSRASAVAEVETAADMERETLTVLADMRGALEAEPLVARQALDAMFPRGLALTITPTSYDVVGVPQLGITPALDPDGSNVGVQALRLSVPRVRIAA